MAATDVRQFFPQKQSAVSAYFDWVTQTTHAPEVFHLGTILPAISFEAARRGLTVGPEYAIFRLIFTLVSGPGSAKSTVKKRAARFVRNFYERTMPQQIAINPYVALRGSISGVLAEISTKTLENDTTPVIFELDELSQILRHDDLEETVNQLYDGETYTRHLVRIQREGGPGKAISNARVNGVFCATPSSLEKAVTSTQLEAGLFSRILWLYDRLQREKMHVWERREPTWETYATTYWAYWKSLLDGAYELRPDMRNIPLSPEAEQYLVEVVWPPVVDMLTSNESRLAAASARTIHHVLIIAGCYALAGIQKPEAVRVELEDLQCAARLVDFANSVLGHFTETLGVSPIQRLAARIVKLLEESPQRSVTKSTLRQQLGRPIKMEFDIATQTLVDDERIEVVSAPGTNGRPCLVYRLPTHLRIVSPAAE